MAEQILSAFIHLFKIVVALAILVIVAKHVIIPIFKKYIEEYRHEND